MLDETKLVRRAPVRPLVWLGGKETTVDMRLGERFPASDVKAKDFLDVTHY